MTENVYHGWIILEGNEIFVEYQEKDGSRHKMSMGYSNDGCIEAVAWWERLKGTTINLQPLFDGCYRVYTVQPVSEEE